VGVEDLLGAAGDEVEAVVEGHGDQRLGRGGLLEHPG
jgi:hypothetical protein